MKKQSNKKPVANEIHIEMVSLGEQVAKMNRKFEDMIFKNADTDEEWIAALISLSFEAARVARALGFGRQEFLNSILTTTDDVYGREVTPKKKAAPKKKPAAKKPVAKKRVKK